MTCPVCKKKISETIDINCPRCKTDLSILFKLIDLSEKSMSAGTLDFYNRKFDDAIKKFQTVLDINKSTKAMCGKAVSFLCKKDFRNALKLYLKCKAKNPPNPPLGKGELIQ